MNNEFDELKLEQRSMASVYAAERHTKRGTPRASAESESSRGQERESSGRETNSETVYFLGQADALDSSAAKHALPGERAHQRRVGGGHQGI
jgi:hypothetical protein